MKITMLNKQELESLQAIRELAGKMNAVQRQTNEIINKAMQEAFPQKTRETLVSALELLAKEFQKYNDIVENMAPDKAEEFTRGVIQGTVKEQYDRGKWESRQGLAEYVTHAIGHHYVIFNLCRRMPELEDKIPGWITESVGEVFPAPAEVEPLPKQPKSVNRYISPTNLLMYDLVNKPLINAGAIDLPVMPKDNITSLVVVTYEGNEALKPFNLDKFERRVMDAVCSLYRHATAILHHEYLVFTPESVYMAMPGSGAKLHPEMRQRIVDAIEKLSSIRVDLDATSELRKAGKIEDKATFIRKQNILYTKGGEYRQSNGRIITAWQLMDMPVIYEYAEKMGQLANVSAKYANIEGLTKEGEPDGVPLKMSDVRRGIVEVMLRRAVTIQRAQKEAVKRAAWKSNLKAEHTKTWREIMTAPHAAGGLQTSDIMNYDKIFEDAGAESTDKHTVKGYKDFCRHVWKYWEKVGFIHGFQEVKTGRAATGLQMLFREPCAIEK